MRKGKICYRVLAAVGFLLFFAPYGLAATYTLDAVHTTIGFAVKHLLISTTRGQFNDYSGTISFDKNDLNTFNADVVIQANSIDTKNESRDNHLRSVDFLDAVNYPVITFKGKKLVSKGGDAQEIVGDLTIRDVTKEIGIPVTIAGPVQTPFGSEAIGMTGETTINRQDFGVSWNKVMDQGGLVVDDPVRIIIEIEAHKK